MNWVIGVPLSLVCGFALDFGLIGLNVGFSAACVGQCIAYFFILYCKNWEDVANEAIERINKEEQELKATRISAAVSNDKF